MSDTTTPTMVLLAWLAADGAAPTSAADARAEGGR
jgi:hypothetical protein